MRGGPAGAGGRGVVLPLLLTVALGWLVAAFPPPALPDSAASSSQAQANTQTCRDNGAPLLVPTGLLTVSPGAGPPTVWSGGDLEELGPYLAPILFGGLGNLLFQLAALHTHALELRVPLVVGYFQHWNRKYVSFSPWGGHPPPVPHITLKHLFPAIRWMQVRPQLQATHVLNDYAFGLSEPGMYIPLPDRSRLPAQVHGYFFNHKYFHHKRAEVLKYLTFSAALQRYVRWCYAGVLGGERETVSLHLRLGYGAEPDKGTYADRKLPPREFYERIFEREFARERVVYLVFADDLAGAHAFVRRHGATGNTFLVVDDSSAVSLHLMSLCKHHILTSSTLSFWGAYLDRAQPDGGRTLLHPTFFNDHGNFMIPYESWEVLEA